MSLTVELSDKLEQIVNGLAQKSGTDPIEILRRSIALLDYVVEATERNASSPQRKLSITEAGQAVEDINVLDAA